MSELAFLPKGQGATWQCLVLCTEHMDIIHLLLNHLILEADILHPEPKNLNNTAI